MIGIYPTVGCMVPWLSLTHTTSEQIAMKMQKLLPINQWHRSETGKLIASATMGGVTQEMFIYVQELAGLAYGNVLFDEDETVRLARATGLSIEELLIPFADALKTLPGASAVALGFELSPPDDFQEMSLIEAGVAVLFTLNEDHLTWSRRQFLPMVGHYL